MPKKLLAYLKANAQHKLGAQVGVKDAMKAAAADGSCGEQQQQQQQQHKADPARARVHKIRRRRIVLKYAQTEGGGVRKWFDSWHNANDNCRGSSMYNVCVCVRGDSSKGQAADHAN